VDYHQIIHITLPGHHKENDVSINLYSDELHNMMTFEICMVTPAHCEFFNAEGGRADCSETSVVFVFLCTATLR
jgi:hypothetical protein